MCIMQMKVKCLMLTSLYHVCGRLMKISPQQMCGAAGQCICVALNNLWSRWAELDCSGYRHTSDQEGSSKELCTAVWSNNLFCKSRKFSWAYFYLAGFTCRVRFLGGGTNLIPCGGWPRSVLQGANIVKIHSNRCMTFSPSQQFSSNAG